MRSLLFVGSIVVASLVGMSNARTAGVEASLGPIGEVLKRNIFAVEQEFFVYHYQSGLWTRRLDALGFIYSKFLAAKMNLGISSDDLVGPGLYVGLDPIQTQRFGKLDPGLFIYKIRKGTKFLNLEGKVEASDLLKEELRSSPCDWSQKLRRLFLDSSPTACLKLVRNEIKKLGVQGFYYSYDPTYEKEMFGSDCRKLDAAINILSSTAVAWEDFEAFAQDSPTPRWDFLKSIDSRGAYGIDNNFKQKINWLKPFTLGCQAQSKKLPHDPY